MTLNISKKIINCIDNVKSFFIFDPFLKHCFDNIVITPTTYLIGGQKKFLIMPIIFRGGPIWPKYAHKSVRHCKFFPPLVVDETVTSNYDEVAQEIKTLENGIWCGPVCEHFGHMIADFMMRVAVSVKNHPNMRLLFTVRENFNKDTHIPIFFWEILSMLGAIKENVYFINTKTLVKQLIVYPQAEIRGGYLTSHLYIKYISSLESNQPVFKVYPIIYFSRGNYIKGGIAGECYLEKLLESIGVIVIRPEEYTLKEQLCFVHSAKKIIIMEGSAVHLLQLLGNDLGDVVIINRRKIFGFKFCKNVIYRRAKSIKYINSVLSCYHYPPVVPLSKGITVLNISKKFLSALSEIVDHDLKYIWDYNEYSIQKEMDIISWIENCSVSITNNRKLISKLKIISPQVRRVMEIQEHKNNILKIMLQVKLFDQNYYLAINNDVKQSGIDAYEHFITYGIFEMRDPSKYFNFKYYKDCANLQLTGQDLFFHYFLEGWKEGINPSLFFNTSEYLAHIQLNGKDLDGLDPLLHYLKYENMNIFN